jgi:hypothetical protein
MQALLCVCYHFLSNPSFRKLSTTIAIDPKFLHGCHVFLDRSLSKYAASQPTLICYSAVVYDLLLILLIMEVRCIMIM